VSKLSSLHKRKKVTKEDFLPKFTQKVRPIKSGSWWICSVKIK